MSETQAQLEGMLVIIGAMKCGTSTLHENLRAHPEVSMSRVKELDFFVKSKRWNKGLAWYRRQFNAHSKVRGESSPNYTKWPKFDGVPQIMHALIPNAKLVYLVRDPIERALSHYLHNVSKGRESRGPDEVLSETTDNAYVVTSSYHLQLCRFLEHYSPEQLRLIELRSLAEHPERVMAELFEWLGVDAEFSSPTFGRVTSRTSKKRQATRLTAKIEALPGGRALRPLIAPLLENPIDKPSLSPSTLSALRVALKPDVDRLREFWGRDLEHWSV